MKSSIKPHLLAIALVVSMMGTAPTAQAWMSSDGAMSLSIGAGNYLLSNQVLSSAKKGYAKASSKKSSTQSTKSTQTKTQTTAKQVTNADRFSPSGSVSSQVNNEMIDAIRKSLQADGKLTKQAEQQLNQLAKSNLVADVKKDLKSDGYDPNSVATAMAYFVVINYGISQKADLSQLKAHTMVNQLKDAMSDDLANMSNADKQKMADMLYWYGSLQVVLYVEAINKNDRQAINQQASWAKNGLSQMGLSVSNIKNSGNQLSLQ